MQFTSAILSGSETRSNEVSEKVSLGYFSVEVLVALLPGVALASERDWTQPAALPPHSIVYGKTLQEWSAIWFKWLWSFPVNDNPNLDKTGEKAKFGDVGPVFFLAGWFGNPPSGTIYRTVSIPANKYIFLGLETASNENVGNCTDPAPANTCAGRKTIDDLYAALDGYIMTVTSLHASIDGRPVPNLRAHREIAPAFSYVLQLTDNLYEAVNNYSGQDARGTIFPVVADGYYLMLTPLSVGHHTINFGGTLGSGIDITYDVTVTPNSSFEPTVLVP